MMSRTKEVLVSVSGPLEWGGADSSAAPVGNDAQRQGGGMAPSGGTVSIVNRQHLPRAVRSPVFLHPPQAAFPDFL